MSKPTRQDYQVKHPNDWCSGCGDFGILTAVQHALAGLQLDPRQVAMFEGIGCSGKEEYDPVISTPPACRVIADAHGHPTIDLQTIFAELAIT